MNLMHISPAVQNSNLSRVERNTDLSSLCIMVAPNGARRTKTDHPALPLTADELGATARACHRAGAAAIHLHVRDAEARHSLDASGYRAAMAAVQRDCPEIAIQTTTEAAGRFELAEQIASVEASRPSCLSFSIAEMMREGEARGEAFLVWAAAQNIGIQFILYDTAQIAQLARLRDAGTLHLPGTPRIILVAGRYSSTQDSDLSEFEALYDALRASGLDSQSLWMTCAFGRGEMACLERTIELGGHVRVGFENAIVDSAGRPARDNAERVAMVADLARKHGRDLASPAEAALVLDRRLPGLFA
jgi:3-keto-5-aminohexanoate cleavage enzyme